MIRDMELSNKDIQMSKGYAVVSMLMLHLFCLRGGAVIGTPLIWLNEETPLIYYIGWLCAICAPTYCLCSGYAHFRQGQKNGLTLKKRMRRCLKFLICYWLAVLLVSILGIVFSSDAIPGSPWNCLSNALLLSWSYTGIWWYAFVYLIYVMLSQKIFDIVEKRNGRVVLVLLIAQFFIVEAANKIIPQYISSHWLLVWIWERIYYLLGARLLCYMGGMYIAQKNIISAVKRRLDGIRHSNLVILGILLALAVVLIVLDKGILIVFYTFPVFIGFNCLKKNAEFSKVMLMLGKYSTYVWLVHPFVYRNMFSQITNIWLELKYPLLLLGSLLIISIIVAYPLEKISVYIIKKIK